MTLPRIELVAMSPEDAMTTDGTTRTAWRQNTVISF